MGLNWPRLELWSWCGRVGSCACAVALMSAVAMLVCARRAPDDGRGSALRRSVPRRGRRIDREAHPPRTPATSVARRASLDSQPAAAHTRCGRLSLLLSHRKRLQHAVVQLHLGRRHGAHILAAPRAVLFAIAVPAISICPTVIPRPQFPGQKLIVGAEAGQVLGGPGREVPARAAPEQRQCAQRGGDQTEVGAVQAEDDARCARHEAEQVGLRRAGRAGGGERCCVSGGA